jgi:SPP1 gp7 family putative phage head morphogenesis protein
LPKFGIAPYKPDTRIWDGVKDSLSQIFYELLFAGMAKIINKDLKIEYQIRESSDYESDERKIVKALSSGKIQYIDGAFYGSFDASISRILLKMGANYDSKQKIYTIADNLISPAIKRASNIYLKKCEKANKDLKIFVDRTLKNLDKMISKITPDYLGAHQVISKGVSDFDEHARPALSSLSIPFDKPTPEDINKMALEYTENMQKWIKKFSKEEIKELRRIIEDNSRNGYRSERLIADIQSRYDVSESKAEFLARQETALFMSKYAETKYLDANIKRYIWRTAGDNDVRPGHKELNGRIFEFKKKAPAKYMSTNQPENPGEDFNCRCVAVPLIETAETVKIKSGEKKI